MNDNQLLYSPNPLTLKLFKKEDGERQPLSITAENLTIQIFSGAWSEIYSHNNEFPNENVEVSEVEEADGTKYLSISYDGLFIEEAQLWFSYNYLSSLGEEYVIDKFLPVRFSMNRDMAELSLLANGIVASIQNTKLNFSQEGLEIKNGGFKITNLAEEEVLVADETTGNLSITGTVYATDGTFKGRIEAKEGEFTGTLHALQGKIGGFSIDSSKLVSTDSDQSIILDGESGRITAKKINLGTGASIEEFILLGNGVKILNPLKSATQSFLIVTDTEGNRAIDMRAPGYIQVGHNKNAIILDGTSGKIYTENFESGRGWEISPDSSTFNDVTVRGSIKASVLEYGEVQTVGGTLVVRPSTRIKEIKEDGTSLVLESTIGFNAGDICLIQQNENQTWVEISSITDNVIIVSSEISTSLQGNPIINFGTPGSVGIGINGSVDSSLIASQAISAFEFDGTSLLPKIILGKLPDSDDYGFIKNSYGLYAENALLKGSLITGTDEGGYSGINTIYVGDARPKSSALKSKIEAFDSNFQEDDILIWAGASAADKNGIENSRFFVDRNGYMYAGGGYFSGAIISDAIIKASEIQTVRLVGSQDEVAAALTIEDADVGIHFINSGKNIFKLNSSLLQADMDKIVFNEGFLINGQGRSIIPSLQIQEGETQNALVLRNNTLGIVKNNSREDWVESLDFLTGAALSEENISLLVSGERKTELNSNELSIKTDFNIEENKILKHGEKMRKEPAYHNDILVGYDLYVL